MGQAQVVLQKGENCKTSWVRRVEPTALTRGIHGSTEAKDTVNAPICNNVSFFSRSASTSLDIRYGKNPGLRRWMCKAGLGKARAGTAGQQSRGVMNQGTFISWPILYCDPIPAT